MTILFCELVGFNSETVQDAMDVVACMNEVFTCFDELMDKYDVYKVIYKRLTSKLYQTIT